ncbi:GYDIA family GHMP kinase [Winogradskyella sp. SYSU M77433]|uniref:GYDIA family GHMP kinase n=1 Tax=Winogradskyella sp. SYSU M77433 TaxID=3042722 RepID=UPI002480B546|nr:GYDIA family GHMP kinase [Winogradskyella sp. SYSU M77433]MDH7911579.1 GYDIA family GHMP kinase [Winogradskyella sp. SYSU M77433]
MKTFRSNGKLLLTSEYLVLDGAKALAIPTKYGQSLVVNSSDDDTIGWKSFDEDEKFWYEGVFTFGNGKILKQVQDDNPITNRLESILTTALKLNPEFLSKSKGYKVSTHLDFNRKWGLGTSSTLINNLAKWANVNPYKLLEKTFGGSGYDIACAQNDKPITYQITDGSPIVKEVNFNPSFKEQLFFVYLNKKQNSRDGIANYKKNAVINSSIINEVNSITETMISCMSLPDFEDLINAHETIISNIIQLDPVKSKFFSDYEGSIKSLGAWGGDFILVTSENNPSDYFKSKGLDTIIPYSEIIK